MEDDTDVGGRDPVLEDRTGVERAGRRTPLERDERHAVAGAGRQPGRGVRTERLLLVGASDDAALRSSVLPPALGRVVLERRPRPAVVGALVDRHRVRRRRTELQTDVRHLNATPIAAAAARALKPCVQSYRRADPRHRQRALDPNPNPNRRPIHYRP